MPLCHTMVYLLEPLWGGLELGTFGDFWEWDTIDNGAIYAEITIYSNIEV